MSGIIGSKLNIRGSGRIAKLGTDGQVLTSSGAGEAAAFEDAATGISWQSVETGATFTAVAGNGYPVNTTAQACTVTLPASASVGDEIIFTDYARNFATNALTIDPNSLKYQGNTTPQPIYNLAGESVHIVYMDATNGWIPINDGTVVLETPQTYTIEWLVIAGGGSGGSYQSGGGGAGGYRLKYASENSGGGTDTESLITLTGGTEYTMTVGAGGAAVSGNSDPTSWGLNGEDSVLSGSDITDITSIGGGGGGTFTDDSPYTIGQGRDGGSGGGAAQLGVASRATEGSGTEDQGYDGGPHTGSYTAPYAGGGGGGASAVGGTSVSSGTGDGGAGLTSDITASSVARGGGGGGLGGSGNDGGGNGGSGSGDGTDGLANTGGGSGGGSDNASASGAGGRGVVILRMADANYSGTTTGSPTIAQNQGAGSDETILTFTGDGTYTA